MSTRKRARIAALPGRAMVAKRGLVSRQAIVRGLIFGSMAIVGVIFVLIVLVIGGIRGVHSLLDIWWSRDTAVWATYFIIGAVFCIAGMLLMRRRHPQD